MADSSSELPGGSKVSETPKTADDRANGPVAIQAEPKQGVASGAVSSESGRGDVSALTIARMMGLATVTEFKFLESKLDLLSTKLNTVITKVERAASVLNNAPTGSDLERIDVQIASLRSALAEVLGFLKAPAATPTAPSNTVEKEGA